MAANYSFNKFGNDYSTSDSPESAGDLTPELNSAADSDLGTRKLKQERIVLGIFGLVIIGVIVLAIFQYRAMLQVPFPVGWDDKEKELEASGTSSAEILAADDDSALKNLDSDGDGLSDYDEKYIYLTGPYLADSDSDGVSDGDELKDRQDPNCPRGQTCFATTEKTGTDAASAEDAVPALTKLNSTNVSAAYDIGVADEVDPAELRKLIISSGAATEEQLQLVSDDELLKLYANSVKASGGTTSTTGANVQPSTNMTASQIRAMLLEQGFTQEELNQIDDETLVNMYKDALREAEAKNQ